MTRREKIEEQGEKNSRPPGKGPPGGGGAPAGVFVTARVTVSAAQPPAAPR